MALQLFIKNKLVCEMHICRHISNKNAKHPYAYCIINIKLNEVHHGYHRM